MLNEYLAPQQEHHNKQIIDQFDLAVHIAEKRQEETRELLCSLTILAPSVVRDETTGIVYFGCSASEVDAYLNTFAKLYRCSECFLSDVPEHLPEFDIEIAIYDMQASSDETAFGLEYLAESQNLKHWGIDSDRYACYTTGLMPL